VPPRVGSPAGALAQGRFAGSAFVAGIVLVEAAWIAAIVYCAVHLIG